MPAGAIPLRFKCACGTWVFVATFCATCPTCGTFRSYTPVVLPGGGRSDEDGRRGSAGAQNERIAD